MEKAVPQPRTANVRILFELYAGLVRHGLGARQRGMVHFIRPNKFILVDLPLLNTITTSLKSAEIAKLIGCRIAIYGWKNTFSDTFSVFEDVCLYHNELFGDSEFHGNGVATDIAKSWVSLEFQ